MNKKFGFYVVSGMSHFELLGSLFQDNLGNTNHDKRCAHPIAFDIWSFPYHRLQQLAMTTPRRRRMLGRRDRLWDLICFSDSIEIWLPKSILDP